MPLSEPSGAAGSGFGIANGTVLVELEMLNTGADLSISFQSALFDDIAARCIFAGDNNYVGSKTLITDKLIQAPSLPTTNSVVRGMAMERLTSGLLLLDGLDRLNLSDANLDNWALVSPGSANTRGVFTLAGDNNIYVVFDELAAPQRNIGVSTDQGATWDLNPGLFAPFTNTARFTVTSRDKSTVAITATAGGDVAISNDPQNTWVAHTVATANDIVCGAFNADNSVFVCCDTAGQIFYTTTPLVAGAMSVVPLSSNPFAQTATSGVFTRFLEYVPAVEGFVGIDLANRLICARIPDTDPDSMEQGLYLGAGVLTTPSVEQYSPFSVVDANGNMQAAGTFNDTALFVAPE